MKVKKRQNAISLMLSDFVEYLPQAAQLFAKIVAADPEDREKRLAKLVKLEEVADEDYYKLINKVANTFITPFDREDIYQMLENLDDVIDELEEAGSLLVGFEMAELPEGFEQNVDHLIEMCEAMVTAVETLKRPNKMSKQLAILDRHESQMDANYRAMLTDALQPGSDPIHAIRCKTLIDAVERAASYLDSFSRSLGAIAIKET